MAQETSTIPLELHMRYSRMAVELESIIEEDRTTRDGRCILGCDGDWYTVDDMRDSTFHHGENCPFTLAAQIAASHN